MKPTARLAFALLVLVGLSFAGRGAAAADAVAASGQEIYARQCASCHGAEGEGVAGRYSNPLHGDLPLEEIEEIIVDSMPKANPAECVGEDAKRVAQYIYETFYTAEARARHRPPRIALSRLTVRQYHNAAADLLSGFVGEGKLDDARGLTAGYFDARGFRRDKRAFERVDATVAFDFGEQSPGDKIGKDEFSIQWQGGVIAPETGEYEFILRTPNGARLWINGGKRALIDAWVRSGDATEHRASCRLLGGRVYPVRLEFFKSKDPTAAIALQWKRPGRPEETIPARNLSPHWCPPTLVVNTPFPPDDRSDGYERGTSISPTWERATTMAAIEIAHRVVDEIDALAKTNAEAGDRAAKCEEFCLRFAERAFRRPLSDEQKQFFVRSRFAAEKNASDAVLKVVLLVLKSPRFLYSDLSAGAPDGYDVASRLSFALWDSLPDAELLSAAAGGRLSTADGVAVQARRMLANPRAKAKLAEFFRQWLHVAPPSELSKDKEHYPEFDAQMAADLHTSLELLVDDVVWGERSDFRQLFLADYTYVNQRLAAYYGLTKPDGEEFGRVAVDPEQYAGVLTHPYVMARFAHHKASSPIHRGVFLTRSVLGRAMKPPPMAVTPLDDTFEPQMTTRERVALQTRPEACMMCHTMINPLGFSLEHFDAVGRFRTEEKGKPIDASGDYRTAGGERVEFNGARQLAEFVARSDDASTAVVAQLFHYTVKQPVGAYGANRLDELRRAFVENDYHVRELLVDIVRHSALAANKPEKE